MDGFATTQGRPYQKGKPFTPRTRALLALRAELEPYVTADDDGLPPPDLVRMVYDRWAEDREIAEEMGI